MYDQGPYGLKDQMVSHSFVLFGTVSSNRIGVQAFVLLYSRFVGTDGYSRLRICTRDPVRLTKHRRDKLSRDPRLVWLAENIPAGVFFWAASQVSRTDLV